MQDFWNFLNGKKTYIALIGWIVVDLLFKNGSLDQNSYNWLITIILGWGGIGITHKLDKYIEATKTGK